VCPTVSTMLLKMRPIRLSRNLFNFSFYRHFFAYRVSDARLFPPFFPVTPLIIPATGESCKPGLERVVVQFVVFGARSIAPQAANLGLRGAMLRAPVTLYHYPGTGWGVFFRLIEHRTCNEAQTDDCFQLDVRCRMFLCPRFFRLRGRGRFLKTISPCPTFRSSRDKWGMGVRQALFPMPALGATFRRLPASRRHSPRQAELSASWQGRPAPRGRWILSEAFQPAWAGGCATSLRTRARHACNFLSRLDHLAQGQPPLLAARSPGATGLASSLSGCLLLTVQRHRF